MSYTLKKSNRKGKKYMILMGEKMKHHFGQQGYDDYTTHGDDSRKEQYLSRHRKRENWTKDGIHTSGFWARWLLWNKPSIQQSIKDIEKRFNVKIVFKNE